MFLQHVRGRFPSEVRVIELLLHFEHLGFRLLQLFLQTRLLRLHIHQALKGQEQVCPISEWMLGVPLGGWYSGESSSDFGIQQQFEHFCLLGSHFAGRFQDEFSFLARRDIGLHVADFFPGSPARYLESTVCR